MALTKTKMQQMGVKMHHWHGGTDGIYAVGSFWYTGQDYPDAKVVESARDALQRMLPKAEAGEHGWTKRDAAELRALVKYCDQRLRSKGYRANRAQDDEDFDDAFSEEEMREGYIITDGRRGGLVVAHHGRALFGGKTFRSLESAQSAISEHMHDHNFYPNVYYVNDHGNIDLLNEDGSVAASRV